MPTSYHDLFAGGDRPRDRAAARCRARWRRHAAARRGGADRDGSSAKAAGARCPRDRRRSRAGDGCAGARTLSGRAISAKRSARASCRSPTRSFDAVVCAFGVGHFAEPERVIAELAARARRRAASRRCRGGTRLLEQPDQRNIPRGHRRLGLSAPGVLPPGPPIDRFSRPRPASPSSCGRPGFESVAGRERVVHAPAARRRRAVGHGDGQLRPRLGNDPRAERTGVQRRGSRRAVTRGGAGNTGPRRAAG